MAVTTLNISESIRPWLSAGLQWLYCDELVAEAKEDLSPAASTVGADSPASSYAPDAAVSADATAVSAATNPHVAPHNGQAGKGVLYRAPEFDGRARPQAGETVSSGHARHTVSNATQDPSDDALRAGSKADRPTANRSSIRKDAPLIQPSTLSPEQWSAEWQRMWAKVVPASPIVWTYWSLGEDLGGMANPKRSSLLKTIISQLHLPKGSNTFWPVAVLEQSQQNPAGTMPDESFRPSASQPDASGESQKSIVADAPVFLSGIQRIRPKYIITFGSKALNAFAPNSGLGPYMQTQFMGCKLIALPDMDRMLDDTRHVSAIVAYLRTAITVR